MGIHPYLAARVFDYELRSTHWLPSRAQTRRSPPLATAHATASSTAFASSMPLPPSGAKQRTALPGFVSRLVALPPALQLVATTASAQKSLSYTVVTTEGKRYTGRELLADALLRDTLANGAATLSALNIDTPTPSEHLAVRQGIELMPTDAEWPLFFIGIAGALGPGKGRRVLDKTSNITQQINMSELAARIPGQRQLVAKLQEAYKKALAKADGFLQYAQRIQQTKKNTRRTANAAELQTPQDIQKLKQAHHRYLSAHTEFDTAMRQADDKYHEFTAAQRELERLIKVTRQGGSS